MWQVFNPAQNNDLDPKVVNWLTKPFRLTPAIKRHYSTFKLELIEQCYSPAVDIESNILGQSAKYYIRKVRMLADNDVFCFARVCIPEATYLASQSIFDSLGDKPIGEHFLYSDASKKIARSDFLFVRHDSSVDLYQEAKMHFNSKQPVEYLFSRHSIFNIDNDPLLITEILTPKLPIYMHDVNAEAEDILAKAKVQCGSIPITLREANISPRFIPEVSTI